MPHPERHIVLFDLGSGGHQGQYMESVLRGWLRAAPTGTLEAVVTESFITQFDACRNLIESNRDRGLTATILPDEVASITWPGRAGVLQSGFNHWRAARKTIAARRPTHFVSMFMDHLQPGLAFGLRFPFDVRISGVYFRPSFHYGDFEAKSPDAGERLRRARKEFLIRRTLRNPHVGALYCLDHYVVPRLEQMAPDVRVVPLPDCANFNDSGRAGEDVRRKWQIGEKRKVVLMFGVLADRKGLFEVITALQLLPPDAKRQVAAVFAGPVASDDRERYDREIAGLTADADLQVVLQNEFVPEPDVQGLIRASDLVLVPYKGHLGPSNVLARSAAERKPVLGTDYGLVGAQIVRERLGVATDTHSPDAIAREIVAFLAGDARYSIDETAAYTFAQSHTAERFANTIIDDLLAS